MSRPPGLYIVPTIHPARFFRDATLAFAAQEDWKKAVRVQREGVTRVHLPIEEWQWRPSFLNINQSFDYVEKYHEGPWAVDFEATIEGEPVCMAAWRCDDPRNFHGFLLPILCQGGGRYWNMMEWKQVFARLRNFLESEHIKKGGQNVVGYDFGVPPWNAQALVKRAWGIDVRGIVFDTFVSHHACFPELRHSLAFQASIVTDLAPYKFDLHESKVEDEDDDDESDWQRVLEKPDEELRVYCLKDSYATAEAEVSNRAEMRSLRCEEFEQFGMPMVPIVAAVGLRGLPFSREKHAALLEGLDEAVSSLEYRLSVAGITDPSSSKKLGEQLRAAGVPLSKRTKGGQWATDLEVLGRINFEANQGAPEGEARFPFLHDILLRARLAKLRSMARGLTPCDDGFIRTALKYIATKSARYSSSGFGRAGKPGFCPYCRVWGTHGTNCQNFPKVRPNIPFHLRGVIAAEPGWQIASLDYKALELRIQAYLMGCRKLIDRLESGMDMHTRHAELMFGEGQVFGQRRKLAKNYIFAKRGAGGPRAIQIALAKDEEFVEQSTIRDWDRVIDAEYPEFNGLIIESQQDIDRMRSRRERVIVRNGFGRPRVLLGFDPLKELIATKISSTAADIMNGVLWRLASRGSKAYERMVLQIHDDFVLYAPEREMKGHIAEVQEEMERPNWIWDHCVSFPVEVKVGRSWDDLYELT